MKKVSFLTKIINKLTTAVQQSAQEKIFRSHLEIARTNIELEVVNTEDAYRGVSEQSAPSDIIHDKFKKYVAWKNAQRKLEIFLEFEKDLETEVEVEEPKEKKE